jgi:hypothetical protein
MDYNSRIKNEIAKALEGLGAPPPLVAIVGSWGDTLSDREVLKLLQDWNNGTFRWANITGRKPTLKLVR